MTREECISQIEWYIPDKAVRNFLFDGKFEDSNFLTTTKQIYDCFSRLLNLTFALIYSKYRKWKNENPDVNPSAAEKFNSYMRITKTFSDLYKKKALRFSTIEPTIIDAQLDIYYSGLISRDVGLSAYLNRDDGNRFAYFVRCAEMARASSRSLDMKENISEKYDDLMELFDLFPYLRNACLKSEPLSDKDYGEVFVCDGGEKYAFDGVKKVHILMKGMRGAEDLDTCFTLLDVDGRYYYLQDVVFDSIDHTQEEDIVYLNYSKIGIEDYEFHLGATAREDFVGQDGDLLLVSSKGKRAVVRELRLKEDSSETENNSWIRDLYAINYRYIKQLAMSISDILTEENKRQLTMQYSTKHVGIFNGNSWDTIIVVLLMKESATNVLQFLFQKSGDLYDKLLNNLQSRFGSDIFDVNKLKEETNGEIEASFKKWCEQYFGEKQNGNIIINAVIEEQRASITADVKAMQLIGYLSDLVSVDEITDRKYRNKYPLNISSHIKMLDALRGNLDISLQRKKERAASIVFRTLKFLYIFYCGFFKYAQVKNEYKKQSREVVFGARAVEDFQRRANEEFRVEVKKQQKRLASLTCNDIGQLLDEIERLNDECMFANTPQGKIKNTILRETLGRSPLLDFSQLQPLKHLLNFENVDEEKIDGRISAILEIYYYLQDGKGSAKGLDGIYPYVGTYEYAQDTRDGSRIAHFSISSPGEKRDLDIEVVSEFRYSINSKYYCLPNRMCCNNDIKLWIEPTIIGYSNFVMIDEYE